MKLLKDILYKAGLEQVVGSTNMAVANITTDSREAKKDTLFIAIRGTITDGHEHIKQAVDSGCVAIVCEEIPAEHTAGVSYIEVANSRKAAGHIATNFFDDPSADVDVIGITGTNGKTTIATTLHRLFTQLGYKVGLLSTVKNLIGNHVLEATHTTPDPISLNRLLRQMADEGCSQVFMEVSSHALHQHRAAGLNFKGAAFTNITHDHLDYHGTFKEYIAAKKILFDGLTRDSFAITNVDDRNGETITQNTRASIVTYGLLSMADHMCKVLENSFTGLLLNIDGREVNTKLIGGFNAYNILCAYSIAIALGEDKLQVLTILSSLDPVEGRFEFTRTQNGIIGIVDYAHTPDALKNVLKTIGNIRTNNETLITLVGCGGDRDRTKRPEMARIAGEMSDKVILTSDNPRSEDPEAIINEMKEGLDPVLNRKTVSITDRAEAIRTACMLAKPGDIILVAGKGHEKYQEINGERFPFDDLEKLNTNLNQIC
jgi:UDP-N-acetylmuramoyl-L-alanyl-D-glutamate--2,6-diaminopimelate ligase